MRGTSDREATPVDRSRVASASEVTTIWRYTNVYIIIIISCMKPAFAHRDPLTVDMRAIR